MNSSKGTTLFVGALTMLMGGIGMLSGLGLLPRGPSDPTVPMVQQQALAICIGVVFIAGGAAAMLTAYPGRWTRIANNLLGLIIAVGLTLLLGWVAIGPGSRGFASPFEIFGPRVNDISGRIMFGLGALLGLLIITLMIRSIFRRAKSPTD